MSRALDRQLPRLSAATRADLGRRFAAVNQTGGDTLGAKSRALRYLLDVRNAARARRDAAGGRALEQWHLDRVAYDVAALMHRSGCGPAPAPVVCDSALVSRQAMDDFNAVILSVPLGGRR